MISIDKLKKQRIPYVAKYADGELVHLAFPAPAYEREDGLRWIRRKCPALYYKITGECRERPLGYREYGKPRQVKKRYRYAYEQRHYADFYGMRDGLVVTGRLLRKLVEDVDVKLTPDDAIMLQAYERVYVDQVIEIKSIKLPVRRLAVL